MEARLLHLFPEIKYAWEVKFAKLFLTAKLVDLCALSFNASMIQSSMNQWNYFLR